jgi:8-oxo-dGTP pyrophosphatase MutT (NUDIX family)
MYRPDGLRDRLSEVLDPSPDATPPLDTAMAAVLVPVLSAGGELRLVFTKRSDSMSRHAGEISFPGGLADEGEGLEEAALREAEEELGLRASEIEVLGALPSVHTRVTGVLIVPFVGLLRTDPVYTPNAAEIADVLEFPLAALIAAGAEREFEHEGHAFLTYVYEMDGHVIWGATARILWTLVEALKSDDS